jgi:WD40 repeat protein
VNFYQFFNLPDPKIRTTQEVLNRSHALVGKTDWLDAKEELSDEDCQRMAEWAQPYENKWAKHEDLDYLKSVDFFDQPMFGKSIDALDGVVERLIAVLERQKDYVHKHTEVLGHALHWQKNQKATQHLLVGKERLMAEEWLLTEFLPPKQPPCQPTALVCEYICEARKNAENLMTDIFICYDTEDKEIRNSVILSLSRYAKTCWTHDQDIQKGADYGLAIEQGIENADNFFFFISPYSVVSEYCRRELDHALKYNKRVVPLLIAPTPTSDIPEVLRELQYVDFTDNTCQADYDSDIDDILNILRREKEYYEQHKKLLARGIKWEIEGRQSAFLLRGHNLDNAQTWLRLNDKREQHPPLLLHQQLITASEAAKGQLGTDVFISYSRTDSDFARLLNTSLQEASKNTWFDQESISTGVDFEKEIFKGIDSADNFVFVLSPDAVSSEYCEREVNYAATHSKRFITVLHRTIVPNTMPDALRKINWIDFKDTAFEKSFPELIQAIELDREHAHQHTVLQQRASDWAENNRSADFLLNITACANAEGWQETAQNKQPAPTVLQTNFIIDSRKAIKKANRKRNILLMSAFVGMIAAGILAGIAFYEMEQAEKAEQTAFKEKEKAEQAKAEAIVQKDKAEQAKKEATKERDNAKQAQVKAEMAEKQALVRQLGSQALLAAQLPGPTNGGFDRALLLAKQAVLLDEERSSQSLENLQRVLQSNPKISAFLHRHRRWVVDTVFSPDGKILASAGGDGKLILWNPIAKKLIAEWEGHKVVKYGISSIAFSPDNRKLASVGFDQTVKLWDIATLKLIGHPLPMHYYWSYGIDFSPDGKKLVAGNGGMVRLWDITTPKPREQQPIQASVYSVAFSPNGKILATVGKEKVQLWDVATQKPIEQPLKGHRGWVYDVTFSPDGQKLATASYDKTVKLWNIAAQKPTSKALEGHSNHVKSVAFSPTGKLVASASADNTVRLWDVATQKQVGQPLKGHGGGVNSVDFRADGKMLASGSADNSVILWDITKKTRLGEVLEHRFPVESIALSSDGKILASSGHNTAIFLWDFVTQKPKGQLKGHSHRVTSLAFSPDNKILASGSQDKTIRLWDVTTQTIIGTFQGHNKGVTSVAFSPDGQRLASASLDTTVILWDVAKKMLIEPPLLGHRNKVNSVAFSPDGKRLASAGWDGNVKLWDVEMRKPIDQIQNGTPVHGVAFHPTKNMLACASYDYTVKLWNVGTQELIGNLPAHSYVVHDVVFSPDGKKLASASADDSVIVWDVEKQAPIGQPLQGHENDVLSVAFSPDGQTLASASLDNTVILWDMDLQSWLEKACRIAGRNLTLDEWKQYLGDKPFEKTCEQFPSAFAKNLVQEGEKLAKEGKVEEAVAKFKEALALDSSLTFDPETKAKQLVNVGEIQGLAGKCLDVKGANPDNGIPIILWTCDGGDNQQWKITSTGEIRGPANKCLDVSGANSANGASIILWPCNGSANQQWKITSTGEIRGLANKCLEVSGANFTDGTPILLWTCQGGDNQKWTFR